MRGSRRANVGSGPFTCCVMKCTVRSESKSNKALESRKKSSPSQLESLRFRTTYEMLGATFGSSTRRRIATGDNPHKSSYTQEFKTPGPEAIKSVLLTRENFLQNAALHVARTAAKDLKPDYARWDAETRARLQRSTVSALGAATGSRPATAAGFGAGAATGGLPAITMAARPLTAAGAAGAKLASTSLKSLELTSTVHRRKNQVLATMFTASDASAVSTVSENGIAAAEQFFKYARPWAGQPPLHHTSKTTASGWRYNK